MALHRALTRVRVGCKVKLDLVVARWPGGVGLEAFHSGEAARGVCTLAVLSLALAVAPGAAREMSVGTVVAWGCGGGNDAGQCTVPAGLSGVTAIAAGVYHSLAVKSDGTVVAWGCGSRTDAGQCSVPAGLSGVTAVAAGFFDSLALKSDGTVVAWGCGSGTDRGSAASRRGCRA